MNAPARYATPRTPGRRTLGGAVAKVAAATRTPFMPWQRQVADVALELLDDGSWAYTDVIVTVQRQSGKTTLVGPVGVHRCITRPFARTWYTAQTRQDARDNLIDDYAPRFEGSPIAALGRVRRSQGSEGLYFRGGSAWRVFAPGEEALHGKANELVVVDEAWAFDAVEGAALAQAIVPTFTTTGGQFWKVSTAGTSRSLWLRDAVARGRAAVEAGVRAGTAYFEWSLPDEHVDVVEAGLLAGKRDPTDPALDEALGLLLAHHPAHGHTLKLAALRSALAEMEAGEFLRAYGNRWTETTEQVIPADRWTGGRWPVDVPWPAPTTAPALTFAVGLDGQDAAVAATWRERDGKLRVDVIDHRPGTAWLVDAVEDLLARRTWCAVGHDGHGPVVDVADQLTRRGATLTATTTSEYAASCAGLLTDVVDGRVIHPGHPALDAAVRAAGKRALGDGAWAWSRQKSAASIAALEAVTVGRWVYDHAPAPEHRPAFYAG